MTKPEPMELTERSCGSGDWPFRCFFRNSSKKSLNGELSGSSGICRAGPPRVRFGLNRNFNNRGQQAVRQVGNRGKLLKLGLRRRRGERCDDKTKAQHAKRRATHKVTHNPDPSRHVSRLPKVLRQKTLLPSRR